MIQANENAGAGNVGVLQSKPLAVTLASGFYLHPKQNRTLRQLSESCLSCGLRPPLTRATITVRGVCGHVAVCKVCSRCVIERGLIG